MANKQYIYSGYGNPNDNDVIPDSITAHYLDLGSRYDSIGAGDIWLWNGDEWRRIYMGGSEGNIASFAGLTDPLETQPRGPSIYTMYDTGTETLRLFIAVFIFDTLWVWKEIPLAKN